MFRRILAYLHGLRRRDEVDREAAEELQHHVEMEMRANEARGLASDEARRFALRDLGGMTQTREAVRRVRMFWLDDLRLDVRHALRLIRRSPTFSATAIVVLALGIGGTVAIFSIVNAVFLKPLPVRAPDELVYIYQRFENGLLGTTNYRDLDYFRQHSDAFVGLTSHAPKTAVLAVEQDDATRVNGELVAANYFDVLGVRAQVGRTFRDDEDAVSTTESAIVISDEFWTRRLGRDPTVLGRPLRVDGRTFSVIGVADPAFRGLTDPWTPSQFWVTQTQYNGFSGFGVQAGVIGRLKRGATADSVAPELTALGEQARRDRENQAFGGIRVRELPHPYVARWMSSVSRPFAPDQDVVPVRLMVGLSVVAGVVLLIACANITGILLARGVVRTGELAVRRSLGAGAWRLVRHLLTESLVLSIASGIVGVALARVLIAVYSTTAREGTLISASIDARVVAFTLGVCLVTGLIVGLAPARHALGVNVVAALSGSAAMARLTRRRLRHGMVIPQVSLALVLLLGAAVYGRLLAQAERRDLGYRVDGDLLVLQVRLSTPRGPALLVSSEEFNASIAKNRERARLFHQNLGDRLQQIPNLAAAAVTRGLPFRESSGALQPVLVTRESLRAGLPAVSASFPEPVSPGFFATMGASMLRGRDFDERDGPQSTTVVVINASLAARLWANEDPIGRWIAFASRTVRVDGGPVPPLNEDKLAWLQVIGVVNDLYSVLDTSTSATPRVFSPITQSNQPAFAMVVARGPGHPTPQLVQNLKRAVSSSDPLGTADVESVSTMSQLVGNVLYQRRMAVAVLGTAGVFGLALALVGLYSVITYSIEQRRREIGIRTALGANRGNVIALVLREGLSVTAIGAGIGLAITFWALKLASKLVGLTAKADLLTYLTVPALILPIVVLACYLPARRAARVDPLIALRDS